MDLAKLIREMTNSPSEIVTVPYEKVYGPDFEDMPRRLPDIGKAREVVGYYPTKDLPEMLESIIAYEQKKEEGRS